MDFRDEAVSVSYRLLGRETEVVPTGSQQSICIPVKGGQTFLKTYEIMRLAATCFIVLCMPVGSIVLMYDTIIGTAICITSFVALLLVRKLFAVYLNVFLSRRAGSLCEQFRQQIIPVGIENAKTLKKVKVVSEDQAVCVLDKERKRLLIEGCAYRYVIFAKDVVHIKDAVDKGLSSVIICYLLDNVELELALCVTGHGPIDSILQAYAPQVTASSLLKQIQDVLDAEKD